MKSADGTVTEIDRASPLSRAVSNSAYPLKTKLRSNAAPVLHGGGKLVIEGLGGIRSRRSPTPCLQQFDEVQLWTSLDQAFLAYWDP